MAAKALLEEFAERTGWSESTMLDLLCEYVDGQMSDDALEEFLTQRENDEGAETEAGS